MTKPVVIIDCETTGLPPGDYRPWEITMLVLTAESSHRSMTTLLVQDVDLTNADPKSLAIGRFAERHGRDLSPLERRLSEESVAKIVYDWTRGATIVAAQPHFDVGCLAPMLARHGLTPAWNRRLRDVESMAVAMLGWDPGGLQACATALGVAFDPSQAHTAAGDVLIALGIWERATIRRRK